MKQLFATAKELILFSLPLILSGILQQLYNWADAFIVGHSGPDGEMMLAAVGATATLSTFLLQTMVGFTLGLSIYAAQEYGREHNSSIRKLASGYLPLLTAIYAVLAVAAICLIRPILQIMDTPAELLTDSCSYLRIILTGIPFLAIYNLFSALFRAVGNTKVAFYAVLLSSLLNVALDILLVLVLPFGVAGAAAATVLSQVAMTGFIVLYGYRNYPELMPHRREGGIDRTVMQAGVRFGLPPMLQSSVMSVGNLFLQNFMNSFGAITVLAITTSYRVDSLMLLPVFNLGAALSSLVARAHGRGDPAKIRGYLSGGLALMVLVAGLLTLLMFFFGAAFVSFFGVTGEALEIGRIFFRDLSIFYILFGIATVFRGVLEGLGDVTFCSGAGIGMLIIRIASSYLLKPYLDHRTIAIAEGICWCILLAAMSLRLWYKRAQLHTVTTEP